MKDHGLIARNSRRVGFLRYFKALTHILNAARVWLKSTWVDLICCCIVFSLALTIGSAATSSGPSLTADSATYISMARNLQNGHGFVSDIGGPLDSQSTTPVTSLMPGYSIFISGLIGLGFSAMAAAKWVSLLSFAVLVVAIYSLGNLLQGRPSAILSSVTVLVLPAVLRLATFALSDISFAALSALSLGAFLRFIKGRQQLGWLLLSGFFNALAISVRYYGMVWVLTGIFVIFLSRRLNLKQRITRCIAFSTLSLLPVIPWFIRNWIIMGEFSGMDRGQGFHLDLAGNIKVLLKTLDTDLLFHFNSGVRTSLSTLSHSSAFLLISAVIILGLLALTWRAGIYRFTPSFFRRQQLKCDLSDHSILVLLLTLNVIAYVCGLIILASNILFLPSDWSRYIAPIYPVLAVLLVDVFLTIVLKIGRNYRRQSVESLGLLAGFILWIVPYSIMAIQVINQTSPGLSWTFSAEKWRYNKGISYLRTIVSPQDNVYSDSPYAVSLLLERPARDVPVRNDAAQITAWLDRPKRNGVKDYVIIFKKNLAGHPPSDKPPFWPMPILEGDMADLAASRSGVILIKDFDDSVIYRLDNEPVSESTIDTNFMIACLRDRISPGSPTFLIFPCAGSSFCPS